MKRSRAVPLTLLGSVAVALTGCGHSSPPPVIPGRSMGGSMVSTPCLDASNRVVDSRFCGGTSGPGHVSGYHYMPSSQPTEASGSRSSSVSSSPTGTARGVVGGAGEAATAGAHVSSAAGGGE